MFTIQSINPVIKLSEQNNRMEIVHTDDDFNQSGFINGDVFFTPDGETHLEKPSIAWTAPMQGLSSARTGSCSVAIESLDQVWIIGGRLDHDPMQSGDEEPTQMVEQMFNHNKSWYPAPTLMNHSQQYCEAEMVGDEIFVVGDWNRNSNPQEFPVGRVQIFNVSNNSWFEGTSMPSGNERGLGGMAEAGGFLYYAGGVRNSAGTDHTNKTWRYNTVTDQWTEMASMTHSRSSFPLVNFHDQLYAIGGTQSTSTWNRQALDYVERYDPATDTWTNLSSLPVTMFGWGATVHNEEIILVGGYSGGAKKSTYHWNPILDTWKKGNDIGSIGHFDVEVQSLNGSIIWATGDISNNPYGSWGQTFSGDTEFQNSSEYYSGWITSPVIDLRPNIHGIATPVSIDLQGSDRPGGKLSFQYRSAIDAVTVKNNDWKGEDGTINSTYSEGLNMLYLNNNANFMQYRIQINISDLENWDEPDLDAMVIEGEHAAFLNNPPNIVHPRGQSINIQTSHYLSQQGEMYLELASCDSTGVILGPWSQISWDGTSFVESDTQGLLFTSSGTINSTSENQTIIDWDFELGDMVGFSNICARVGSDGSTLNQYYHPTVMVIDRLLQVSITDLGGLESGQAIPGANQIDIGIMHHFPSTGQTLSSGDVQARLTFYLESTEAGGNGSVIWYNDTTPWSSLSIGSNDIISWTPPLEFSGVLNITLEARSDQPLTITTDTNMSWFLLDNDAPFIYATSPENSKYINSMEDREISITIADTSGFISQNVNCEIWVQSLDDGSDGSMLDGIPQSSEYRIINHTMQQNQSLWTFTMVQSDNNNSDHQLVWVKLTGDDKVGNQILLGDFWWETRDAQNGVVEGISDEGLEQIWEVEREISWTISISDANSLSDIMHVTIELGGDSSFGMKYYVADYSCLVLDYRINGDRLTCSHTIENDLMIISVSMVAGWEIDLSMLNIGEMKVKIEDIDGFSSFSFDDMWVLSDAFDFSIDSVEDITGTSIGVLSEDSIVKIGDDVLLTGTMIHSSSKNEYNGTLSIQWWGTLNEESWSGGATISVIDGIINTTIPMPNSGGRLDMTIVVMDPYETRTLGIYEGPAFYIDADAPLILESDNSEISRYHLENIAIGVNILESNGWSGLLNITCQIKSTELDWQPITMSQLPSTEFQGKYVFSFYFDLSGGGDPTKLSIEARLDCWAEGMDDSGWDLLNSTGDNLDLPWLSIPLTNIGPNIQLVEVVSEGEVEPGRTIRLEVSIKNTGEDLTEKFNITVHTNVSGVRELVVLESQGQIKSGQGINKIFSLTVPEGDWILEVEVDSDNSIWELNENDNSYSKEYSVPIQDNTTMYIGGGVGIVLLIGLIFVIRGRSDSEDSFLAKSGPDGEIKQSSGPPKDMRRAASSLATSSIKKGPPPAPKKEVAEPLNTDVNSALSKLSLDNLPGRDNAQPQSVPSYDKLPGGGEYEYLAEGTFYSGETCGRWLLKEDGSFTKVE